MLKLRVGFAVVFLLCLAQLCQAQAVISTEVSQRIDAAVDELMKRRRIPAISLAVARDNKIILTRAYGIADLEHNAKATDETVFRIASVSKPITAVGVMKLVEEGKIDLNAPIDRYLPSFPAKQHKFTTRQLLGHLSGVRHYKGEEALRATHYVTLADALKIFAADPLEHEPGAKFTYTTYGYTLLGLVIEKVSGMDYIDYMKKAVFEPAGMRHTFADDTWAIVPNRARGYGRMSDTELRNARLEDTSYKTPGGGLLSSAGDLARFAIATQNGTLIKPETFVMMSTAQKIADGTSTPYGLGWFVQGRPNDRKGVWHGGAQQGATSELLLRPDEGVVVAIIANMEGGGSLGLIQLADEIADIATGRPTTQPTTRPE